MKYLFFDIECANCDLGKGKICSFGYALTDEKFTILESDDVLINPDAPFHLTGRRDKSDIKLGYSEAEFLSSPKFPEFADRIFSLISDKDTCVFGYAVVNDINFLLADAQRYGLKMPDLDYYDVQMIYSDYMGISGVVGLERASKEFGGEIKEEHVSLDDALNTLRIAEGIANRLAITMQDVLALSYRAKGRLRSGERSFNSTTPRKKVYEELKAKIYGANPTESESVKKEREERFNIHSGEKRLLHNYKSGSPTATIGELLKGLDLEV